jgi:hypothetical protein
MVGQSDWLPMMIPTLAVVSVMLLQRWPRRTRLLATTVSDRKGPDTDNRRRPMP